MIVPFAGEFLVVRTPLELSFNYCSFSCAFCFANLTAPNRTFDAKATLSLLRDFRSRETLSARLLQEGYPIAISNRVDPFAHSNAAVATPILRTLVDLGLPFQIASRGGIYARDALDFLPPVIWYLSINQDSDALRQRIEPGAPSIESRVALCEELTKRGHVVVVGFNPFIAAWWQDFPAFARRIKDAGAHGAWVQRVHLNRLQIANMTDKERTALGAEVLRAGQQKEQAIDFSYLHDAVSLLTALGLETYWTDASGRTRLFDVFRQVYPKVFPIMQDFFDWCFTHVTSDRPIVSFQDFCTALLPDLPSGEFYIRDFIGANNRQLWQKYAHIPTRGTFKQLLALMWNEPEMAHGPIGEKFFSYATLGEGGERSIMTDSDGLPYLVFSETGFSDTENFTDAQQWIKYVG